VYPEPRTIRVKPCASACVPGVLRLVVRNWNAGRALLLGTCSRTSVIHAVVLHVYFPTLLNRLSVCPFVRTQGQGLVSLGATTYVAARVHLAERGEMYRSE